MKKTLIAGLLAAASAIPLSAQAQGYVGLNVGQARTNIDASGLTVVSRDENKTAYKIYGGYQFTPNWGAEVGYADLGKPRITFLFGGANVAVEGRTTSFYVAGTGTLPVNDKFSLHGKLGVAFNRINGSATIGATTINDAGNQTGALIGIGASYHFTKNLSAVAEYEDFGKTSSDSRAGMWSLGLRYKF